MATKLTADDLTGIAYDANRADDPRPYITELIAIADDGRLADEGDAAYALGLASDLVEEYGGGEEAISLARRAVEKAHGTIDEHWVRARCADLLLRYGYDDEGMRELGALRPQLTRDEMAATYVIDALTENDRAELAEKWLTAALTTAVDIVDRAEPGSAAEEEAGTIEHILARRRRFVRDDLGLEPDEVDLMVDEIDAEAATSAILFWPEAAFNQMLEAFPDRAEMLGATWDVHRAEVEKTLQDEGPTPVEVATPELLRANLAGEDLETVEQGPLLEWPPGRNDPCWCGSRVKYKKCCLPRARS